MTSSRRAQNPFREIIGRLRQEIDVLIETASTAPPSTNVRRRLDTNIRDLMGRMDLLLRELDPVQQPHFIFDPGNPAVVGRFIALAMIAQPRVPLTEVALFYGSGIYAIY